MATSEPRVVGKSLPRMDGAGKVTGTAVYAADFAQPGMLVGKVFRSTEPHARIVRVDTARARALPGVRAVMTAADVPDVRYGGAPQDETGFAPGKGRYVGQPAAGPGGADPGTPGCPPGGPPGGLEAPAPAPRPPARPGPRG